MQRNAVMVLDPCFGLEHDVTIQEEGKRKMIKDCMVSFGYYIMWDNGHAWIMNTTASA